MQETISAPNGTKFLKPDFECTLHFISDGEWVYGEIDDDTLNLNHKFMCSWNINCGTAVCVAGDHDFSIYNLTPAPSPWHESLDKGKLCWVWGKGKNKELQSEVVLITCYRPDKEYKYIAKGLHTWFNAEPLTLEEVQEYIVKDN